MSYEKAQIAVVRQEFLAGASLRELSQKHAVSLRTLATWSKREDWNRQRELQRTATTMPVLAQAADCRVAAVNQQWRGKIQGITDGAMTALTRITNLLEKQDFNGLDGRELVTAAKILSETVQRLGELQRTEDRSTSQLHIHDPEFLRMLQLRAELRRRGLDPDADPDSVSDAVPAAKGNSY